MSIEAIQSAFDAFHGAFEGEGAHFTPPPPPPPQPNPEGDGNNDTPPDNNSPDNPDLNRPAGGGEPEELPPGTDGTPALVTPPGTGGALNSGGGDGTYSRGSGGTPPALGGAGNPPPDGGAGTPPPILDGSKGISADDNILPPARPLTAAGIEMTNFLNGLPRTGGEIYDVTIWNNLFLPHATGYTPPTVDAETFADLHGITFATPELKDSFVRSYSSSAIFRDAVGRRGYAGQPLLYEVRDLPDGVAGQASLGGVVLDHTVIESGDLEYIDNVLAHETFHHLGVRDGPQMTVLQEAFRYEAGITDERGNVDLGPNFSIERFYFAIAYDVATGSKMTVEDIVAMSQTDFDIPGLDESIAFGAPASQPASSSPQPQNTPRPVPENRHPRYFSGIYR